MIYLILAVTDVFYKKLRTKSDESNEEDADESNEGNNSDEDNDSDSDCNDNHYLKVLNCSNIFNDIIEKTLMLDSLKKQHDEQHDNDLVFLMRDLQNPNSNHKIMMDSNIHQSQQ